MQNNPEISQKIVEAAPLVMGEIQKASSILLCLHPSPDPDSVGSNLAMALALERMGKKATVLQGDSPFPEDFEHFPGAQNIVRKDISAVDLKGFDIFMSIDAASIDRISYKIDNSVFSTLKVIDIDHHPTNLGFGYVNLVEPAYPSSCQIISDLFTEWGIELTPDIAMNLFMGLYSDTGGFKYKSTTAHTFDVAAKLSRLAPNFPDTIEKMENSRTPSQVAFMGATLSSVETFLGGKIAIASADWGTLESKDVLEDDVSPSFASSFMRSVRDWGIVGCAVETKTGQTRFSFRTNHPEIYDLARLTSALGGGGHKAAAGLSLALPLDEAKKKVVEKAREMYNL